MACLQADTRRRSAQWRHHGARTTLSRRSAAATKGYECSGSIPLLKIGRWSARYMGRPLVTPALLTISLFGQRHVADFRHFNRFKTRRDAARPSAQRASRFSSQGRRRLRRRPWIVSMNDSEVQRTVQLLEESAGTSQDYWESLSEANAAIFKLTMQRCHNHYPGSGCIWCSRPKTAKLF